MKIQLGEGSAAQVTKNMLANEGIGSFYKVRSTEGALDSFSNILMCVLNAGYVRLL